MSRSAVVPLCCAAALAALCPIPARADQALAPLPVKPKQIRVDGYLGEWGGGRFAELGDDADGALEYALGYDDKALYLGARVFDDSFVRTARPGKGEDAVVLSLAMPLGGKRWQRTEVWLFAGVMGKQKASAGVTAPGGRPTPNRKIEVVEGPAEEGDQGYVLEARIPWSAVPGGKNHHLARGAIRLRDVDAKGKGPERELWSSLLQKSIGSWPPVLAEAGPNAAMHGFLRDKGATSTSRDLIGDVSGDGRLERVAVSGTFVAVVGAQIRLGGGYSYMDLPVAMGSGVREAELRDMTGDGKAELLVRLRQQNDMGSRDVLQVVMLSADPPRKIFATELRKQTSDGSVEAEVAIRQGRPAKLEVSAGTAKGLSADNYRERPSSGTESILLPWGKVAKRVYQWDGSRFAVVEEEENEEAVAAAARAKEKRASAPAGDPGRGHGPQTVIHPKPPGMDELVRAFRDAQGISPRERARFIRHVNVAEDRRIESIMVFGKHLLVIGKGFQGGTGWFYFTLPVRDAGDIQRLFTGDVTGDGRREIFVRYKQQIEDVQREILIGYSFHDGEFKQILSVEVRRARGSDSIGNVVALVRRGKAWALSIDPGKPRGWDQGSYPFVAESMDGHLPILLPWKDGPTRYAYTGGRLVR